MRSHRSAFTLIEVLISIGIGMVIVYTTFVAFRASSQMVTAANRLSLENAMLRAGMTAAHEEMDFWRSYDDPEDATKQPMRAVPAFIDDGTGATKQGLPFTPLSQTWGALAKNGGNDELDVGWDTDPQAWSPHRPRTWYHGNMAEHSSVSGQTFGRYGLFGCEIANPFLYGFVPGSTGSQCAPAGYYDDCVAETQTGHVDITVNQSRNYFGQPDTPHLWYYRQLRNLVEAVGFYGFAEYMPASAIWKVTADPTVGQANWGGEIKFWELSNINNPPTPAAWTFPLPTSDGNGAQFFFCNTEFFARGTRSRYRNTDRGAYALPCPVLETNANRLNQESRRTYQVGWRTSADTDVPIYNATTDVPQALLPSGKPDHWPQTTYSVGHAIKNGRAFNICHIRLISPLTGQTLDLSFAGYGTTLRGARQQRKEGLGWAAWDDKPGSVNDQTLDGAAP